jgi:hypothetical protein
MSRPLEAAPSALFPSVYRPVQPAKRSSLYAPRRCTSMDSGKSMGLTQAQMAGLIRVPVVTVRAWEAGTLEIKSKRLIRAEAGRPAILRVARLGRARQTSGRVHGPSVSKRETRRSTESRGRMISTGALRSIYAVLPMTVVPLAFADPLIDAGYPCADRLSAGARGLSSGRRPRLGARSATRRDSSRRNASARRRMVVQFRCYVDADLAPGHGRKRQPRGQQRGCRQQCHS